VAFRNDAKISWLPSDGVAYEILARHDEGSLENLGVYKRECILVEPTTQEVCLYDYADK
jgi:hypothetical protein